MSVPDAVTCEQTCLRRTRTKRLLDVVLAGLALVVLTPLFLAVALAIVLTDGRPVFYVATRVGQYGREFHLFKFRTMVTARVAEPAQGSSVTVHNDPRITPIGRVLRATKIDELPQFFNVVRGDMSLVGPRPEDPEYVALYTPEQRRVLDLKPGITSVAALEYVDEGELLKGDDWETVYREQIVPAKLALEAEYAKRRTLLSDIGLLFRTAFMLVRRVFGGG
jgi:lipopolysaccharide/colanic/teichoic acid biosynthesis glycosyltransferase